MIAFDIETIPDEEAISTPTWKAYKEKHECEDDAAAALLPAFCQVVSVAAYDLQTKKSIASASNSEKDILGMLADLIGNDPAIILGGHNIKGFDIPVCAIRMLRRGIKIPACMMVGGKKPYEIKHVDTMEVMKFGGFQRISLDAMCLVLGVKSPKSGPVVGNSVWEAYKAGRLDEICAYNKEDVNAWIRCYQKLNREGIV